MAGIATNNDQIVVDRDYTDNFAIKNTAMTNLGQKYFEDVDLAGLNIGELGFVLEQIANITEDSFNTASIMINESFPNRAMIPESIYSHAAVYQLDANFATCGSCSFIILLRQDEILSLGKKDDLSGVVTFVLDKETSITVEDIPFTLDYDIEIKAKPKKHENETTTYIYSAQYILNGEKNTLSSITNPYIKTQKNGGEYVILQITCNQVERTYVDDTIINNTKVNYPVINFEFDGNIAGFDIYYKKSTDTTYTQLKKLIKFSLPIKDDFCYYKLKDDNTLEITFANSNAYFQPDFNSELKLVIYTTLGKNGNFESYNGTNVEITTNSETYTYNDSITIAAKPVSECLGGNDRMTLEQLKALTVEAYSTATEISTENDIMTYFYNYKYRYDNEILVIKRRDDITERLFSAFLLVKNGNYIYPTNTLYLDINIMEFDTTTQSVNISEQASSSGEININSNEFVLYAGHLFKYKESGNKFDTCELIYDPEDESKPMMVYDLNQQYTKGNVTKTKLEWLQDDIPFIYTNPFLLYINKLKSIVGMYKSVVNQTSLLEYNSSNQDSFEQFISSRITLDRNLDKARDYTLSLSLTPSATLDTVSEDPKYLNGHIASIKSDIGDSEYTQEMLENNDIRVVIEFTNSLNSYIGYIELYPVAADNYSATFEAVLQTDDDIKGGSTFSILNAIPTTTDTSVNVPITDENIIIHILYKNNSGSNKFYNEYNEESFEGYSMVNKYDTSTDPLSFITPMNLMRSTVSYSVAQKQDGEEPSFQDTNFNISLLPLIKATLANDEDAFNTFINKVTSNYEYLTECIPMLRNNTNIDIKFYNTYGRSNNYYVIGNDQQVMDKVNLSINFDITIMDGVNIPDTTDKIKNFIKEFIEEVNSSGNNELFISNLISKLETNFSEIHHLKFSGINNYSTDYQTIGVIHSDINDIEDKEERRRYVPEILVVDENDIQLTISVNKNN